MTEMMRELCDHELNHVSGGDGAVAAGVGVGIAGAAAAVTQGATQIYANALLIR